MPGIRSATIMLDTCTASPLIPISYIATMFGDSAIPPLSPLAPSARARLDHWRIGMKHFHGNEAVQAAVACPVGFAHTGRRFAARTSHGPDARHCGRLKSTWRSRFS